MRVLVACEYSGVVREAFAARGHDAWSCDLLPTEQPGQHIQGDVLAILGDGWDLMVAHPPCTHLAYSGNRWHAGTPAREEAKVFFRRFLDAPIERICVENPVGAASQVRRESMRIQPWQFGHGETKNTCLWLKGLPPLMPTRIVTGRENRVWLMPPGPDRWKERSRTYTGIANAMADQWGILPMAVAA